MNALQYYSHNISHPLNDGDYLFRAAATSPNEIFITVERSIFDNIMFFLYHSNFSTFIILPFLLLLGVIATQWSNKKAHLHTGAAPSSFLWDKLVTIIVTALALGVMALPTIVWMRPGSIVMLRLAVAFVMTACVFILGFVKLKVYDYAILFSCFAYIARFVGIISPHSILASGVGIVAAPLLILASLLSIYKIRLGQLKGNLFHCWFTIMLVYIVGYKTNQIFWRLIVGIGQRQETRVDALIVWGSTLAIACAICTLIIFVTKKLLRRQFENINLMGRAYPIIERFIIYNSIGVFAFLGLANLLFGEVTFTVHPNYGYQISRSAIIEFSGFILFSAMALQLSFVILVFKITWLKENLKVAALNNQHLIKYSSNLEKSMDQIQHIKHDVKNIFLTMSNFVERSNDKEMQDFYSKKISPFAADELTKNDLMGKLSGIENEQLKAFIFYKISQAIEHGVNVDVQTDLLTNAQEHWAGQLEFVDLVRILGVLLDNAIEECEQIPNGYIFIKISFSRGANASGTMTSYVIKNTVRPKIRETGIRPGSSTKGDGRGKGLAGVRAIIDKYDTVLLNSYFVDDCFVQNLVVGIDGIVE